MPGVISVVAISPPYVGPPAATWTACLSTAYSIALRTAGSASPGRLLFIARYSSAPDGEVASLDFTVGSPVTRGSRAAGTEVPVVAADLSLPESATRRWLMTSGWMPMSITIESGWPVRAGSEALSQLGLRSSSSFDPGASDFTWYGPLATGL